jgi:iron complex transport system ATP-binding protein
LEDVSCGYGKTAILQNIGLTVSSGEILCLVGPNGIGKTTLFKTILGFLPALHGAVYVDGKNFHALPQQETARYIGYVPQSHTPPFAFLVSDVILMGRTAHLGTFSQPEKKDRDIVDRLIETLGIGNLRDRVCTELSGGERQMALIARALAQEPAFILMDEPTSNLDFGNQALVLEQILKLKDRGIGVIMTTHYPEQVLLLNTRVALIKQNKTVHTGNAKDVLTGKNLRETYGIPVAVMEVVWQNRSLPFCQPILSPANRLNAAAPKKNNHGGHGL